MHTIKTTPKITAMVAVVLFGFALIAAPKFHPSKKIVNAAHTRIDGFISWLMAVSSDLTAGVIYCARTHCYFYL